MSQDVLTIGSTMRIPLLYRGEYSQWVERFMNYLEEQTDGEVMINSIKNGDQPLPCVTQVSIAGTLSTEQSPLKDKSMWSDQEKKTQNIDRDVNDAMGLKKKTVVVTSDPLALIAEKTKKITALLTKAFNRRMFYSKPTNNNLRTSSTSQSANKKQDFVKSDDKKVEKKDDEKKRDTSKMLLAKKDKDEQVLLAEDQAWMESSIDSDQEINANMVFMAQIEKVLSDSETSSSSANDKIYEVSYYLSEYESESEYETSEYYDNTTTYEKYAKLEAERYEYMIRYSAYFDNDKQHRKQIADQEVLICYENPSYFEKAKDLRPSLYDEKVIGLGYTPMFLTHSDEALEIEKFKRARENEFEFAYDYGNLNATNKFTQTICSECDFRKIIIYLEDEVVSLLEKEKANLETIESLKSKGFESSENAISKIENQSENNYQVVEKECDNVENPKVIAPGMFKLSVSQSVSPISVTKTSCASNGVENLDTFSCVRRPKHSGVIWNKKGSSNTSNVDLSYVSHLKLNKDVKRYSRKDLLSCNNSHPEETSSAYVCNDGMNVSCNSRLCDSFDENNLFIFDDESVRIYPVSKMTLRKKPRDSKNFLGDVVIGSMTIKKVYYVEGLGHNLFSVGQFCDKGLEATFRKSTCFVRNEDGVDLLTGDRSLNLYTIAHNKVASNLSTCLLAKASSLQSWLWHQRLSHLNFTTINKILKNNLVQGLPKMKFKKDHLCFVCEQGKIHRKHHKSKMAFASNKPLYLLHMDLCGRMRVESINRKRYVLVIVDDYSRYTWVFFLHSKDEAFEVIISFIKKTQVNLQLHVQHVRFELIMNATTKWCHERRNRTLVEAARTMITFANLPLFLWAEAIATTCFIRNRSIIHKRFDKTPYELLNTRKPNIKFFHVFGCRCYLLNDFEDVGKLKVKGDIGVFVGYSKESAAFRIDNKQTRKIHESVNIMKSSTTNVETSINEKVFHEVSKSFQGESSSSSFNDDVQQSPEEVILPQTNTQSILNNMVPDVDEASTSQNVFNKRLEDAYFDASTSFHDPTNVHTFYQPYPHEKKWTKDHPLHKIIAEALRDADWVSAIQEELDQFARLKTSFLNEILKEEVYVGQPLVPTPMVEQAKLKLNIVRKPVDHAGYRSMIGSLMIFRYLKGTISLGLWYLKDSGFDLTAYSDADHAGCHLDRKTESEYVAVSSFCAQVL
nr:hypothetical protein [Tanacetum cinerariifolium]